MCKLRVFPVCLCVCTQICKVNEIVSGLPNKNALEENSGMFDFSLALSKFMKCTSQLNEKVESISKILLSY